MKAFNGMYCFSIGHKFKKKTSLNCKWLGQLDVGSWSNCGFLANFQRVAFACVG